MNSDRIETVPLNPSRSSVRLSVTLLVSALFVLPTASRASDDRGYSLKPGWETRLLRILDRYGRPDPVGPIQQRFTGDRYAEYRLDLEVAHPRLAGTLARAEDPEGLHLWVQSIDEFDLATRIEFEKRVPHQLGYVGFRYDRFQTRQWDSNLFRVDFGFVDIPVEGAFGAIRFYPRWRKDDSDVELQVGFRDDEYGVARLRALALDPFTNASAALAESRGRSGFERQLGPGILLLGEILTARWRGLRGELYGGLLPRFTTRYTPENVETMHRRTESARLLGGMVEWRPLPELYVGTGGTLFDNDYARRTEGSDEPGLEVDETTTELKIWAIVLPMKSLELEALLRRTARPERRVTPDSDASSRTDREWWSSLRANWWFHRTAGADLTLIRISRDGSGPRREDLAATNYRLSTRLSLRLGDSITTAFGVGWDLDDPAHNVYDGGGMVLTARF